MAKKKTVKLEDTLGKLTPQQQKAFAAQYNGGLGSGMTPEQYKKSIGAGKTTKKTGKKK